MYDLQQIFWLCKSAQFAQNVLDMRAAPRAYPFIHTFRGSQVPFTDSDASPRVPSAHVSCVRPHCTAAVLRLERIAVEIFMDGQYGGRPVKAAPYRRAGTLSDKEVRVLSRPSASFPLAETGRRDRSARMLLVWQLAPVDVK